MANFSAKFEMQDVMDMGDESYEIVARVVDNSGMFSLYDVTVGNVIYVFDNMAYTVSRYLVESITSRKSGKITLTARWDVSDPDRFPEEPNASGEAVIGARNERTGTIELTSSELNSVSETTLTMIRNFEQDLIADYIDTKEDKLVTEDAPGEGVLYVTPEGEKQWLEVYTKEETEAMLNVISLKEFE